MGHTRCSFRGMVAALFALLLLLAPAGSTLVHAQDATPAVSGLPPYPELLIKAANSAFDLPAQVPAGRTLITLENDDVDAVEADLIRLPAGIGSDKIDPDLATPQALPAWFAQATLTGGPGLTLPGARTQVVVDLTPGKYAIVSIGSDPQFHQQFEVTSGSDPAAAPRPVADASIEMQEYAFGGLPAQIAPGQHVWQITNTGQQPHLLFLFTAPSGITTAQLMTILTLPDGATPPPDLGIKVTESDFRPMGGLGVLSPGQTGWAVLDLPPGTYMVACFVPDPETGVPHALMGMVAVITVGGAAAPAASPSALDVPDPSECIVAPRTPASLMGLMATPIATNEMRYAPPAETPRSSTMSIRPNPLWTGHRFRHLRQERRRLADRHADRKRRRG